MAQAEKRSGSYSTRVSLTDPLTGERIQKRVTARTKRELDAKVAQIKAAWHLGSYIEPSNEPFGHYLGHYLETAAMAANTRKSYAGVVRRIISSCRGLARCRSASSPGDISKNFTIRCADRRMPFKYRQ